MMRRSLKVVIRPAGAGEANTSSLVPSGGMCPNGHVPCPFGPIFVGSITFVGFIV
jgi:hypothetical protein